MRSLAALYTVLVTPPPVRRAALTLIKGSCSSNGSSNLRVELPSDHDRRVVQERQLGHKMDALFGCGTRCKHGFPQAVAYDPVCRPPWVINGKVLERKTKLESALFRLTCPLLVQAIDEWEAEGAVKEINREVQASEQLSEWLATAHAEHAQARREVIGERTRAALAQLKADGVRLGRPVEQDHATRRRIADMYAEGMSLSGIARTLNDEQVPTARGGRWHPSTIKRVLDSLRLDAEVAA